MTSAYTHDLDAGFDAHTPRRADILIHPRVHYLTVARCNMQHREMLAASGQMAFTSSQPLDRSNLRVAQTSTSRRRIKVHYNLIMNRPLAEY